MYFLHVSDYALGIAGLGPLATVCVCAGVIWLWEKLRGKK